MAVKVKLFANFREIAGEREISISGKTAEEVLENLIEEYNGLKEEIFTDYQTGKLKDNVNILVNGREIQFLNRLETRVEDGDTVAIFPPVAGG